jgi:hypothetical protein
MKSRTLHALALTLPIWLALASCTSTQSGQDPKIATADLTASPPMTCPISGDPVTTASPNALYGVYPVYCTSVADAKQFASLAPKKRAIAAAAQVLPQKGIRNRTCPLTGEALTAAAAPVNYEGDVIGFATLADANQFKSLAADKRAQLVREWRQAGDHVASN